MSCKYNVYTAQVYSYNIGTLSIVQGGTTAVNEHQNVQTFYTDESYLGII